MSGFIVGSWDDSVELVGISEVGGKIQPPDMIKVLTLVRAASQARGRRKKK